MSGANAIRYRAPGPVAAAFVADRTRVAAINGPIGGGKTTAGLFRPLLTACAQMPSTRDGFRKFKLCVVRDTYRSLWRTTIPSWHKHFPGTMGRWVGSDGDPAMHELRFNLADGSTVLYTVDFVAIGDNNAEDVLKGYEPTAFLLEEGDGLSEDVFQFARGRAGRFPMMNEGGPTWYGVLLTFNAPALGNWAYKTFYRPLPDDIKLFQQPSGLSAEAENLQNLPPGYYQNQMSGQPEWYIDKMIRNKPGISRAGKPIYPEFSDTLHVADHDMEPVEGLPLLIGLDAGGSPAATIAQRMPNGQWRIYDELCAEPGTGPTRFGKDLAKLLHERYPQWGGSTAYVGWNPARPAGFGRPAIRAWADPSATYGADRVNDEMDWTQIVSSVTGIRVDAAPTNNPSARWDAVRAPLTRLIDGKPGFLLNKRCTMLRDGFNAGYRFRRVRTGGDERFTEEADKNEYSHVHDSCQYVLSAGGEDLAIRDRKASQDFRHLGAAAQSGGDWDPLHGR